MEDAKDFAARANVSLEAVQLLRASEVIDLHLETYIPPRLWGYDLHKDHLGRFPWGYFFGHLDLPRVHSGGLTGAMWSIATNITRSGPKRPSIAKANVEGLQAALRQDPRVSVVRNRSEYDAARREGRHAALITIQGGNAFEDGFVDASGVITRVTVVHLSNSTFGDTSSPARLGKARGLTDLGRAYIRALNQGRVFVDLAHASEQTFWDALEVHDRTQPPIVTHTCMRSVNDMWRNITDKQAKAIADLGGVVGVMFHRGFLGRRHDGKPTDGRHVITHLEAILRAGGEHAAALGSDYDGFIVPPSDLLDGGVAFARLVQYMLDAKWTTERIQNVLGQNFLRSFAALRP
jgi:membrane dipeptidase